MSLLHAIRWACLSWWEVYGQTIENCWNASTVLDVYYGPQANIEELEALQKLLEQGRQLQIIRQSMDIHRFIDPPGERIYDVSADEALTHVIELFTEPEDDSGPSPEPPISHTEAINCLEKLLHYEGLQDDSKESHREALEGLIRKASTRRVSHVLNNRQQMAITSFFCT